MLQFGNVDYQQFEKIILRKWVLQGIFGDVRPASDEDDLRRIGF